MCGVGVRLEHGIQYLAINIHESHPMRIVSVMLAMLCMVVSHVATAQDLRKARPYHRCEIYDCPFTETFTPYPEDEDAPLRTVRITFSNTIRGYRVSVVWNPVVAYHGLSGPATITFSDKKTGKKHIFVTNYFSMPESLFPESCITKDGTIDSSMDGKRFVFTYPLRSKNSSGKEARMGTDMPFTFQDIDHDGHDELVIVCAGSGQRSVSVYHAYEMRCHDRRTMIDYHDKIDGEAACFDGLTEFDNKKRTMTRMYSGGAGNSDLVVYKWVESTSTMTEGMRELLPVRLEDSGADSAGYSRTDDYVITRKKTKLPSKPQK